MVDHMKRKADTRDRGSLPPTSFFQTGTGNHRVTISALRHKQLGNLGVLEVNVAEKTKNLKLFRKINKKHKYLKPCKVVIIKQLKTIKKFRKIENLYH